MKEAYTIGASGFVYGLLGCFFASVLSGKLRFKQRYIMYLYAAVIMFSLIHPVFSRQNVNTPLHISCFIFSLAIYYMYEKYLNIKVMKIEKFKCGDGNVFAIDTKKYRYWIPSLKEGIQRFPISQVVDKFGYELSENMLERYELNIKWFIWSKFYRGFHYKYDFQKKFDMLFNKIELLEEDIQCVHKYLDSLGIPRKNKLNEKYSLVGRIKYKKS
jgi:hypothetical protein